MPGRFFDEWKVGDRVEHSISRTVTETDNLLISTLTHNPQPLHIDHEAAAKTEFGKPLVNSVFTFGLMIGVSVNDTTLGTLVANLGYDKLVFLKPVFVGDTLRSESECIDLRESKSRPNAGIVTWAHRSFNQRGELVCEKGTVSLGAPGRTEVSLDLAHGSAYPADWRPRFADAYRLQNQAWIQAIAGGKSAGASAWDGYAAAAVAEAGLRSLAENRSVAISLVEKPALYS